MRRWSLTPRVDWTQKVEALGLVYHTFRGKPYWFESACYEFLIEEVERVAAATTELHARCLDAVEHVIAHDRWADVGLPERFAPLIRRSWDRDDPSIYGRFDLAWDGTGPPKLLEYNADTPTSLLEAAVIQWDWLQAVSPQFDQFNRIWEALVEKWRALRDEPGVLGEVVHFAHAAHWEDVMTVATLRDTAAEAGIVTHGMEMRSIGWDPGRRAFVDLLNRPIRSIFKLYPWEWMFEESFADPLLEAMETTVWTEPAWKAILSSKGVLAILWELFPDHPNLLPTFADRSRDLTAYARKPFFSREGANVTLKRPGEIVRTEGEYGGRHVYQQLAPVFQGDGGTAILGSWVIDGEAAGMGIRESDGPVTDDWARFVPHRIV